MSRIATASLVVSLLGLTGAFSAAAPTLTLKERYFCKDIEDARAPANGRQSAVPFTKAAVLEVLLTTEGKTGLSDSQRESLLAAVQTALAAWRYGCADCSRANALVIHEKATSQTLLLSGLAKYIAERPEGELLALGDLLQPGITKMPAYGSPVSPIDLDGTSIWSRAPGDRRQGRNPYAPHDISLYVAPSKAVFSRVCSARETDNVLRDIKLALGCSLRQSEIRPAITVAVTEGLTQCGAISNLIACEQQGLVELSLHDNLFYSASNDGTERTILGQGPERNDLEMVLVHEIGHWLGVPHAPADAQQSVMQTSLAEGACLDRFSVETVGHQAGSTSPVALVRKPRSRTR